jgi:malate permease and related proteins
LSNLLVLFLNNILPIFLVAGTGFLAGKYLKIEPRSLSQVLFYILTPCLIFDLLTATKLNNAGILQMAGFTAATILAVGLLTWVVGALLRIERRLLVAVVLTAMFSNAGNFGLSLNQFAFGESALAYASLYFVTSLVMTYTVGVFIASLGSSSLSQALLGVFKIPVVYAVAVALLINGLKLDMPLPLNRAVSLLSDATVPMMLMLMGLQLQRATLSNHIRALSLSNFARLLAAPALALGFSLVFGLQGPARQAGITESGTPTAVIMTVLATEYDLEPSFVTTVVFMSTLLCPLTLTPLLAYLGA